jgi:putative ABC transport system permease protein
MSIIQIILEALESLSHNKLRSILTVLGIVIGVAAVISMLAIGTGAQESINTQINALGSNLVYVMPGGGEDVRNAAPLTTDDAEALADPVQAPSILYAAPVIQGGAQVSTRGESLFTSLLAVGPEYAIVSNLTTSEGQFISNDHINSRAAVVVLGSEVAEALFGKTSGLVGEKVRISNQVYRVIGVLESVGGSSMLGSQDDRVIVPLTTAQSRLIRREGRNEVDTIYVQARSAEVVPSAVEEINRILATRHGTTVSEPDFNLLNMQDIQAAASSITGVLTIFLGGIAGISLLVGGIGIMNIMYVTVSERTREIGLRKALGARKWNILVQFLAESALLSLIGGIIGILLAQGISLLVGFIAVQYDVQITPLVQLDAVLLATLFSAGVGLFFGFYPARRAANLQPVEALRYE